jgi:hypothetical protein
MSNPLAAAVKGKGFFPLLARGGTIATRYSLSPAKMEYALSLLMKTLTQYGCRATIPVTAVVLARNYAIAQKYQAQGLELAVHGLAHIDHSELGLDNQRNIIHKAQRIFQQAGVYATGFRSPYLRWNADTIAALKECGFSYDSSQALAWDVTYALETDAYRRVLAFYRAQSASEYPALPQIVDSMVRIPYCLPDDEALVERLGLADAEEITRIWLTMLDRTYTSGELLTIGLHPERMLLCREAIQSVLAKARSLSPAVWIATLEEIAAWQRALSGITFEAQEVNGDRMKVTVRLPEEAVILIRSLEVEHSSQPWGNGYRLISTNVVMARGAERPFIGLSAECPPNLQSFLHAQGYLVEIGQEVSNYGFYLNRPGFQPKDERSLLAEIEEGEWPLIRLGRWPGGARSALAVTGDIDAVTLWDYGFRAIGR